MTTVQGPAHADSRAHAEVSSRESGYVAEFNHLHLERVRLIAEMFGRVLRVHVGGQQPEFGMSVQLFRRDWTALSVAFRYANRQRNRHDLDTLERGRTISEATIHIGLQRTAVHRLAPDSDLAGHDC